MRIPLAAALCFTLLLSACDPDAAYKRGVESAELAANVKIEKASQDGYKKGYDKGYMDAFAAKFPGSGAERPEWVQVLQGLIGFLAALKIAFALVYANIRLIFFTKHEEHVFGRILMGVLGTLGVFWLAHSAGIFDDTGIGGVIKTILFYPIPHFLGHLAVIIPAGFIGFGMVRLLMTLHEHTSHKYAAAFHVLWLSAAIAIYVPLMISVFQLPSFGQFVVFDLLAGWLTGSLFYTARKLLDHVPSAKPPAPVEKPTPPKLAPEWSAQLDGRSLSGTKASGAVTLNDKAIDFDKIRQISRIRSEITITFDDKSTIECHKDHFSGSITLESLSLKEPLIVGVEEIQYFIKNS